MAKHCTPTVDRYARGRLGYHGFQLGTWAGAARGQAAACSWRSVRFSRRSHWIPPPKAQTPGLARVPEVLLRDVDRRTALSQNTGHRVPQPVAARTHTHMR